MTLCAYIRVSTDLQTVENQKFEIDTWCKKRGWPCVEKWVSESGVSGAKDYKKRKLGQLMSELKEGDTLIASEISRFGRDLMMVMEILRFLIDRNIKVYTVKDNFSLSNEIQSKVIAFAFGLAAEIERKLIRQRTKAALDRLKSEGKKLGRPKGATKGYYALRGREDNVIKLIEAGESASAICAKLNINRSTLLRFKRQKGYLDSIRLPQKKKDVQKDQLLEFAKKGYSYARVARTLSISESTVRKYALRYGINFEACAENENKTIYNELDSKKDEIIRQRISGKSMNSIRQSLGVSSSTWCHWCKRVGLTEIKDMIEARKKTIDIQMLVANGFTSKQIAIALNIKRKLVETIIREKSNHEN